MVSKSWPIFREMIWKYYIYFFCLWGQKFCLGLTTFFAVEYRNLSSFSSIHTALSSENWGKNLLRHIFACLLALSSKIAHLVENSVISSIEKGSRFMRDLVSLLSEEVKSQDPAMVVGKSVCYNIQTSSMAVQLCLPCRWLCILEARWR